MKKTLVKICGITNSHDADAAVRIGADALGFVFYQKSPRYVDVDTARKICKTIPGNIMKIGVFVNENRDRLESIYEEGFLDYFQLHGDEDPEYCKNVKGKIIKSFRIKSDFDSSLLRIFGKCAMFLFDTKTDNKFGGSGNTFDWKLLRALPRTHPIILAGGLTEKNVGRAIETLRPDMVDVSSSVESSPGIKDHKKVLRFINSCRNTANN